uniref:Uncharacterized protein n=1 Tax=Rhizophora mucronata TaxID=61149 RepID=A0A2P2IYF9_RHIMU
MPFCKSAVTPCPPTLVVLQSPHATCHFIYKSIAGLKAALAKRKVCADAIGGGLIVVRVNIVAKFISHPVFILQGFIKMALQSFNLNSIFTSIVISVCL